MAADNNSRQSGIIKKESNLGKIIKKSWLYAQGF
jgi:hypothetical protein